MWQHLCCARVSGKEMSRVNAVQVSFWKVRKPEQQFTVDKTVQVKRKVMFDLEAVYPYPHFSSISYAGSGDHLPSSGIHLVASVGQRKDKSYGADLEASEQGNSSSNRHGKLEHNSASSWA